MGEGHLQHVHSGQMGPRAAHGALEEAVDSPPSTVSEICKKCRLTWFDRQNDEKLCLTRWIMGIAIMMMTLARVVPITNSAANSKTNAVVITM